MNYTVRLGRSSEKTRANAVVSGKPDFKRIRTRLSFTAKDGTHRFDLTFVEPNNYEVEIEYLKVVDLQTFFNPVKLVIYVIKGDKEIVSSSEYSQVIKYYNSFFEKEARFDPTKIYTRALPKPINFKRKFVDKMQAYSVTNKQNGTRMVGIIMNEEIFVIDMVGNVLKIGSKVSSTLNGTIFDSEYFNNIAYPFDLLFDRGQDVRKLNEDDRLHRLRDIALQCPTLSVKVFKMSGNLRQDTIDILELMSKMNEDDNDGIIYTPITESYFNNHIYKWKPPDQLTIDFQASKIGDDKYTLQVLSSTKNNKSATTLVTFAPTGFSGTIESKEELKGIGEYRWISKQRYVVPSLDGLDSFKLLKKNDNGTFVIESDSAEMKGIKLPINTFELVRLRPDKDTPNFITIAQDVWEDIMDPITAKELLTLFTEVRGNLRKFHNSIKKDLIVTNLKGKVVLDLGAGKGGDLSKYQLANINKLYAVEPNTTFRNELENRIKNFKDLSYKVEIIPEEAQNTFDIKKVLAGKKVDAVTMFFSLSFFFENRLILGQLLDTIDETTDIGSLFLGTTIDGNSVVKAFGSSDIVEYGPVTLKKMTTFTNPIGYGKTITYKYTDSATVSEEQTEWLVDWDLFVQRLSDIGFEIIESQIFPDSSMLSQTENDISKLYRTFIFKRKSYKKLKVIQTGEKKHLKSLKVGQTVTFNSVLLSQLPDYKLTRTGTHANGDCFFHAIKTAIDPAYRTLSSDKQIKEVQQFRSRMEVDEKTWELLGNGSVARVGKLDAPGFDILFNQFMTSESKGFAENRNEIYQALGSEYGITNFLSSLRSRKAERMNVSKFIGEIKRLFPSFIVNKSHQAKATEQLDKILIESKQIAHQNFVKRITACGSWVGDEVLELVSDEVNRDIFVVNDYDGSPYITDCNHVTDRTSIVIVFQGGNHYECLGRLNGTKVQREFTYNDPLILLIKKQVC